MFKFKQHYFSEWRFWYKLILSILICMAIIYEFTYEMTNPDINFKQDNDGNYYSEYDYSSIFVYYFSFFTTQSNILVFGWLFFAALNHDKEGKIKLLKSNFAIAVATYISVTGIIFNTMLLPVEFTKSKSTPAYPGNWNALKWIYTELLHTIGPILTILYIVQFMNLDDNLLTSKTFMKKQFPKYLIYPLIYGIYILIRNELRIASNKPRVTNAPYFFMELRQHLPWFFIASTVIILIILGFSTLYNFLIKKHMQLKK